MPAINERAIPLCEALNHAQATCHATRSAYRVGVTKGIGVHQRILQSKKQSLEWVNDELAGEQATFLAPQAGQESGRMADLVAYRGMIESVPEWPFTLSTYTRIALYVLIPIATWDVGLIAEEILDSFFN